MMIKGIQATHSKRVFDVKAFVFVGSVLQLVPLAQTQFLRGAVLSAKKENVRYSRVRDQLASFRDRCLECSRACER